MTIVMDLKDYTLTQFLSDTSFRMKISKIWLVSVARLSWLRLTKLWWLRVTKLWLLSVAKLFFVSVAKLWLVSVAKQTVKCGKFVDGKCCKTAS